MASLPTLAAQGQSDPGTAAARRQAIEQFYPVMIEKVRNNDFNGARELCHLAIKWEPAQPLHFYNLACIEARAGNENMGLAALTKAADLGYADTNSAATHPDLTTLRNSPIYAEQYRKIQANAGGSTPAAAPSNQTAPTPEPAPARASGFNPNRVLTRPQKEVEPAKPKLTDRGPVGLYLMSKRDIISGYAETAAWYFSPEWVAYKNPTGGLSPEQLDATKDQAAFFLSGDELTFAWLSGHKATSKYVPDADGKGFTWDDGIFVAAKPFTDANALVGKWSGGAAVLGAAVGRDITFNADGTFSMLGASSISGSERTITNFEVGGTSDTTGTWQTGQYSLTLTKSDGSSERAIAFPFDPSEKGGPLMKFYYKGILFSRQE